MKDLVRLMIVHYIRLLYYSYPIKKMFPALMYIYIDINNERSRSGRLMMVQYIR